MHAEMVRQRRDKSAGVLHWPANRALGLAAHAPAFGRAVDSLTVALSPGTNRHYRGTVRKFLTWLGAAHPEVRYPDQLRRDPHILGWMSCLRFQTPPWQRYPVSTFSFACAPSLMNWRGLSSYPNSPA